MPLFSCLGHLEETPRAWRPTGGQRPPLYMPLADLVFLAWGASASVPLTVLVTTGPAITVAWGQGHSTGSLRRSNCLCRTRLAQGQGFPPQGEEDKMRTRSTGNSSIPLHLPAGSGHCLPSSFIPHRPSSPHFPPQTVQLWLLFFKGPRV